MSDYSASQIPGRAQDTAVQYRNVDASVSTLFQAMRETASYETDSVMSTLSRFRPKGGTETAEQQEAREEVRRNRSAFALDEDALEGAREVFPLFVPNIDGIVFDPRSSLYKLWETLIALTLVYTATVTPFDVAVVNQTGMTGGLFWCNRVVDLLFLLDLLINLRLAYYDQNSNQIIVVDTHQIQSRYLKSWFAIDLISVLPLEMIDSQYQIVKMLRLLRLLKLLKLARFDAMIKRWQTQFGVHYSTVNLCLNAVVVVLAVHWAGCLWFLLMKFEDSDDRMWIESADSSWRRDNVSMFDGYCAAIYHASITLTTIGYGDIVAMNDTEQWVSVLLLQLSGAWMYAYIIAISTAIISSINRETYLFNATVDSATDLAEEEGLPNDLLVRVKDFLEFSRNSVLIQQRLDLIKRLSLPLQAECMETMVGYIEECPYFANLGKGCKIQLALRMTSEAYPAGELILRAGKIDSMIFIVSGMVSMYGKVAVAPQNVGAEAISKLGIQRIPARAITDVRIFRLSQQTIYEVLRLFPQSMSTLRRQQTRLAFKRGIKKAIGQARLNAKLHSRKMQRGAKSPSKLGLVLSAKKASAKLSAQKSSMAIGRPDNKVDEWESKLQMDDMANVLQTQHRIIKLDQEICELTEALTMVQNKITKVCSKDLPPDDAYIEVTSKIRGLTSTQKCDELIHLQEEFWEGRHQLDHLVS